MRLPNRQQAERLLESGVEDSQGADFLDEYRHGSPEGTFWWVRRSPCSTSDRAFTHRYCPDGETTALIGAENWSKLTAIGCVEAQRQTQDKTTTEYRYYLLSLPLNAKQFADAVRGHWSIENQLHWILDVGFGEDQCRTTQGHSAENLAVIRHLALSLLSQDQSTKGGTRAKRLKAGWDDRYLIQLLARSTPPY